MSIAFSEELYTQYEAFLLSDEEGEPVELNRSIAVEAQLQDCSFCDVMDALFNEWRRRNLQ